MIEVSDEVLAKAQRLVDEHRVHPIYEGPQKALYAVDGDTGRYNVFLWPDGSGYCTCPAQVRCSHFVAAYGLWKGPDHVEEGVS